MYMIQLTQDIREKWEKDIYQGLQHFWKCKFDMGYHGRNFQIFIISNFSHTFILNLYITFEIDKNHNFTKRHIDHFYINDINGFSDEEISNQVFDIIDNIIKKLNIYMYN